MLAAVSVSNPFDLLQCCEEMDSGIAYWYGRYFLKRLRSDLLAKQAVFQHHSRDDQLAIISQLGPLHGLRTLREFDDAVTAPLHGFAGARDYYQRCSSRQFLPLISAPVLLVHGRNDPVIPLRALPALAELSPNVECEILDAGGHVGFAADGQPHWLERRILRFIELTQRKQSCSVGAIQGSS